MNILEALKTFDKDNDAHWTADGLPRLDVLKELTGATVSRADLLEVAKGFSRFNTTLEPTEEQSSGTTNGEGDDTTNSNSSDELDASGDSANSCNVVNDRDMEIEKRYREAQRKKQLADAELVNARAEYDAVIMRREAEKDSTPFHLLIKKYQASQLKQREQKVKRAEQLKLQMVNLDAEEKALLNTKL